MIRQIANQINWFFQTKECFSINGQIYFSIYTRIKQFKLSSSNALVLFVKIIGWNLVFIGLLSKLKYWCHFRSLSCKILFGQIKREAYIPCLFLVFLGLVFAQNPDYNFCQTILSYVFARLFSECQIKKWKRKTK